MTAGRDTVTNLEAMHILGVSARHLRRLVSPDISHTCHNGSNVARASIFHRPWGAVSSGLDIAELKRLREGV